MIDCVTNAADAVANGDDEVLVADGAQQPHRAPAQFFTNDLTHPSTNTRRSEGASHRSAFALRDTAGRHTAEFLGVRCRSSAWLGEASPPGCTPRRNGVRRPEISQRNAGAARFRIGTAPPRRPTVPATSHRPGYELGASDSAPRGIVASPNWANAPSPTDRFADARLQAYEVLSYSRELPLHGASRSRRITFVHQQSKISGRIP